MPAKVATPPAAATVEGAVAAAAIATHSTDTTDEPWDGQAAERALRNEDGAAEYRQAYAWVNPAGDPDKKNSYWGHHHMVSEEGAVGAANVAACQRAIRALNGARGASGVPAGDRQSTYNHLRAHLSDAGVDSIPALKASAAPETVRIPREVMDKVRRYCAKHNIELALSDAITASPDGSITVQGGGEWHAVATVEGVAVAGMMGKREFAPGSLKTRALPLPLMLQREASHGSGQPGGAVICGAVVEAFRDAAKIMNAGVFDTSEDGIEAQRLVDTQIMRFVSIDAEVFEYELVMDEGDDPLEALFGGGEILERYTDAAEIGLCYSDDTEILTDSGWKRFDHLERGVDRVATRNQKTHAFEWQEPTHYTDDEWDSSKNGPMVRFKSRGIDLLVTPNHRMLLRNRAGSERFVPAAQVAKRQSENWGIPLVSEWHDNDVPSFRIDGPAPAAEGYCACGCGNPVLPRTQTLPPCAVEGCAGSAYSRSMCNAHYQRWYRYGDPLAGGASINRGPNRKVDLPPVTLPGHGPGYGLTPLTLDGDDFAAFMGAYLAEGSLYRPTGRVVISQMSKSRGYELYGSMLTRMFGQTHHNGKCFVIDNRRLCDYLDQFGHAPEKFVPAELKEFSRRQLRLFWEAYMAGDGSADGRKAYTTSKRLADDLQEIGQKIGLWVTISAPQTRTHDQTMPDGRVIKAENCLPAYILGIHNLGSDKGAYHGAATSWRWENTEEDYVGPIHCVTVPNESLYVRRNGKPSWCGNTIVPHPAFAGCVITMADMDLPETGFDDLPGQENPDGPLAIAAGAAWAATAKHPPASWFANPNLSALTHARVTPEGRVYGHVAPWREGHVGYSSFRPAPRSPSGYSYFLTGRTDVLDEDGTVSEVSTGRITLGTTHAESRQSYAEAVSHYDHTGFALADVACGEDQFGIWFSGALRPDVSEEKVRVFKASDVSGDWRTIRGAFDLIGILTVNAAGYPVAGSLTAAAAALVPDDGRVRIGLDEEDHEMSLVAAGVIRQGPATAMAEMARRLVELEAVIEPLRDLALERVVARLSA